MSKLPAPGTTGEDGDGASDVVSVSPRSVRAGSILDRGHPGHLTPAETEALEAVRAAATTEQLDQLKYEVEGYDSVLCRYLRARKFDVAATVTMINESFARRQQDKPWEAVAAGPSGCLDCPEIAFKRVYPHHFRGFDKLGRPVLYDQVGRLNVEALLMLTDIHHMVRYHWFTMCKLLPDLFTEAAHSGRADPRVGLVSVLDLQGLSTKSLARDVYGYIREISAIDQLCFPELLGRLFIINTPRLFSAIWAVIKVWLDPKTVAKIEVISKPAVWRPRLAEVIRIEEIPEEYGGQGPPLKPLEDDATDHFTLSGRAKVEKRVDVRPGQTLRVEVFLASQDLEVAVARVTTEGKLVAVQAPETTPPNKEKARVVVRKSFLVPEGTTAYVVSYRNCSKSSTTFVSFAYAE